MQAVIATQGELIDCTIEMPEPGANDLLVEVQAVSVNPVDVKVLSRAKAGDEKQVLGFDAVGIVRETGAQAQGFRPGDRVWYAGDITRFGSNAEFQCVDARIASQAPTNLSDAEAAAMPLTLITAWELLFDRLQLPTADPNAVLLVIGGAGGVGSILIQLAKQLTKATVVATASRHESQAWVNKLGADFVLDHSHSLQDELKAAGLADVSHVASLTHSGDHFETVVDLLRPQGHYALIDDPAEALDIRLMKQKSLSLHWEFMFTRSMFSTTDIERQGDILRQAAVLFEEGKLHSTVTQSFSPINAATLKRAHQLILQGHTVGKIVVTR